MSHGYGNGALPDGWAPTTLGRLLSDIQPGFASGEHSSDGVGLPHLRPMNVSRDGRIDRSDLRSVTPELADRPARRLRRGDVLFNNTNSLELVGKTALFDDDDAPAFSNHMTRLRVHEGLAEPAFIARLLHGRWRSGEFQVLANNHVSQASVGRGVLVDLPIAIPPLPEQRRIAAQLEDIEARRVATAARLRAAAVAVECLRGAVLAAACSGRLTADWRESHPSQAGSKTLVRELTSLRAGRRAVEVDETHLDRPSEWQPTSLDELLVFVTSGSRGWAQYYAEDGPLFIRAQNIRSDRLDLTEVAHVRPPKGAEGARTRVIPGDLLITITGANVTKAAFVDGDVGEAYVNQHVALARPLVPEMTEYLHLWLVSPAHGRKRLLEDAYGAGKPGLNLTNIRSVPIAVPSLDEQREIVRLVDVMLTTADRLVAQIEDAAATLDRASKASLAAAFRGELVPTEAELAEQDGREFESAEELLAPIDPMHAPKTRQSWKGNA